MSLLIFRTNIKTQRMVNSVKSLFNNHPQMRDWSIDTEDIDNVLRIESLKKLSESEVIYKIRTLGFYCEVLNN